MNNAVFWKPIEKWGNGNIKLVTKERRKNYLVSKPDHDTTNFFTGNLLATKMKKIGTLMNTGSPVFLGLYKPVYLGLLILESSKILMVWLCKFKIWRKSKIKLYEYRQFHCIHKNRWYYKDILKDAETIFDTSNHEWDRPLPKRKSKKVIGLMKDELGEKIKTKFVGLRAKTYSYITDDGSEDKKKENAKKSVS